MAGTGKRVTLKDVAVEAGVSVGLASRVLTGSGSFSERSAERVREAVARLGYRPNHLARSLRLGRSGAIGLVFSSLVSTYWATFVREVEAEAAEHGMQVIVRAAGGDAEIEREHVLALLDHPVDAIIAAVSQGTEAVLAGAMAGGLPVVLFGSDPGGVPAPRLNFADREAARAATEHVIALGHDRVGFIAGATSRYSARERLAGYREAVRAAGGEELVGNGEHRYADAYAAASDLLALPEPATALVVANEVMGGAVLQLLKDRRVQLPEQVSVVVFGDPHWAEFYRPALTSVRLPRYDMARLAVEVVLAGIDGTAAPVESTIPATLIVRESTSPPGAAAAPPGQGPTA